MDKLSNVLCIVGLLICGLVLQGCAGERPLRTASSGYGYGTVQSIEVIQGGQGNAVAGTLIGAAVGAVVGHQVGQGTGNDIATAAGAVGGAIAGHEIQERSQQRRQAAGQYRVHVRMPNGELRTYADDRVGDLRVGERVRVDANQIYH